VKMKFKFLPVLSAVALAGALLSGCGNSNNNSEASQPAASQSQSTSTASASTEPGLEKELVIAGNGATVQALFEDEIFKKFNEKYPDVKLTYVSGVATEIVAKAKASQSSPQFDIAFIEAGEQENGRKEGLWEPISDADVPNMKNVLPQLQVKENSGVTIDFTPMGISYNADLVKKKNLPIPTSWNDLAKPEMKGNITLTDISSNFGRSATIMMSYANGGSEKNMDAGFEKLAAIAGYMPTFAKNAAQLQQNLQDESAAYTAWTMARSIVQKEAGLNLEFVVPQEGANLVPTVASLVKNASHPNAAKEFINFLLTDEVQTLFATKLYYNPATSVSLPEETAKQLAFDTNKIVNFDYDVISQNMKEWMDYFNKEIAPKAGK
jgi:putative spermidine/putrescine transport system substrate-binding protein